MNNMNMAGMNAMGGPVGGGGMPMMNNGVPGNIRPVPVNDQQRSQLNTYIYEYFLRNEMWECARAMINSDQPINVHKNSPGRRRDGNGNLVDSGVSPEGTDGDSKDDIDSKRPDDLPAPNLPKECPESCFLYEWWCLFWDMFNAQRGKGDSRNVMQYVTHTQQNSRSRQEQQQQMLRQIHRPDAGQFQMLRNQQNGMNMGSNDIARKAMQNNHRNVTPQQLQMLQQQQQQQQQAAVNKQQQMQRDGSDLDGSRRPQSPSSVENAPSPSKRPRIDGPPFNQQQGMMPNGRGQQQGMPGQQVGPTNNTLNATQLLLNSGINPNTLTAQQFQQFSSQNPANQSKALQNYTSSLATQQQNQMPNKGMPNPGGPQSQGSPMMAPGQDGGAIATYYNTGDMGGANGMRPGTGGQPGSGGNHALQDYQMQLMLLEQQNKKRLMMARQEQDNMGGMPREGPGGPGPNGQPFQGTSPQGGRTGTSPNLNDPMKRGTPQLNAAGIPSPLPEGQSRGSPGAMNFMPSAMDPNMPPHFYKQMNGMDANMVGAIPNGMRPPSSVPTGFNNPMTQQMMNNMARVQQQGGAVGPVPGWQGAPNGAPMMQQASQGPVPQAMGTPQQRAMLPPSAPATGAAANGRTQPPSPQQNAAPPTPSQTNKANPKGKKDAKPKRNQKKATTTTGATPAAATENEPATPTPATPITPMHAQSFNKNGQNGGQQNTTNGQTSATASVSAPQIPAQQDVPPNAFMDENSIFGLSMDFANPAMGSSDVLQDFDFDSFLHQDGGENDAFAFDASAYMEGEVGAE